jgi:peptidoglycan/xylan/chitin deacetylase (PgdA/CDA1 family)
MASPRDAIEKKGELRGQFEGVKPEKCHPDSAEGFPLQSAFSLHSRYTLCVLPYLIGLGAAAAAGATGYQSMAPTGQWLGRAFTGLPRGRKQIALTYDDGPNDPHTLRLLDVLARHDVRATFFMIGRYVQQRPDIVRAVAAAGHVIGNHTMTHPLLIFESAAQTRTELVDCRTALTDAVGEHSNLFRPPFGGRRPATLRIARELGLEPIMWNVTGYDWNAPPAAQIEKKVAKQIRGGDVILLHDGGHKAMGADRSQTVIATDNLIRRYKDRGYEFVTVMEMMIV